MGTVGEGRGPDVRSSGFETGVVESVEEVAAFFCGVVCSWADGGGRVCG